MLAPRKQESIVPSHYHTPHGFRNPESKILVRAIADDSRGKPQNLATPAALDLRDHIGVENARLMLELQTVTCLVACRQIHV